MIEFDSRSIRIWSRLGPSGALGVSAIELAKETPKSIVMTADLCSFSGLERYASAFPDRFFNMGIAEQNMVGVAAGLAKEGFVPILTTYASFCSSRCADQVRVNMSYMRLPIKLIGLAAGCAAGILGATHMSIEDVAFMRALPNITIISPSDCSELVKCVLAVANTSDPTYIRVSGSRNTPIVNKEDYDFRIGVPVQLERGKDIAIIASGSMVYPSLKAIEALKSKGVSCSLYNFHTIKPLATDIIEEIAESFRGVVVVEEASIYGGLYGAICEKVSTMKKRCQVFPLGMNDFFCTAGSYHYQMKQYKLDYDVIVDRIMGIINDI